MLPVLIYQPRKDERLSWPRWLQDVEVAVRWFTQRRSPIQVLTGPDVWVTKLIETNALPLSHATTLTASASKRVNIERSTIIVCAVHFWIVPSLVVETVSSASVLTSHVSNWSTSYAVRSAIEQLRKMIWQTCTGCYHHYCSLCLSVSLSLSLSLSLCVCVFRASDNGWFWGRRRRRYWQWYGRRRRWWRWRWERPAASR